MTEEGGRAKGDGRAAAAWLPLPLRERGTAHEMRRYLDSHGHGHDGGSGLSLPLWERAEEGGRRMRCAATWGSTGMGMRE